MKIAVIIERANINLGGAERSVFELTLKLRELGVDVDLLAAKGPAKARNTYVLCDDEGGKRSSLTAFEKKLRPLIAQNHYDIVHSVIPFSFADVYQPRGGSFAESIIRNAESYRNELIRCWKRITAFANWRRAVLLRAEKNLCKDPNGPVVAALSQYVKEQFKRHYALPDNRIVVIPNGIKTNRHLSPAAVGLLRTRIFEQLKLQESSPDTSRLFLFVANNFRLKGLGPLIKAMQLLCQTHMAKAPCLIVAGTGKARPYRLLAKKLGIADRILFIGQLRRTQKALAIADVAVLPTFYDPCSRYILEALAAGKPVITTRFNGATDAFIDNRHGKIISDPNDIRALADAMAYYMNRTNLQNASAAITADNLEKKISITRHAEKLMELYKSIAQNRDKK